MKRYISQLFKHGRWLVLVICISIVGLGAIATSVRADVPTRVTFYGPVTSSIASGVAIPEGQAYYWSSGTVPPVINPNAPVGSRDRYGDTKTQATGIIVRLESLLKEAGLTLADVIYLRVYLVADPVLNNKVDFQGWFDAYAQFFNTRTTPKVARSTVAVAGLVDPSWLIEIEAFAVYPK